MRSSYILALRQKNLISWRDNEHNQVLYSSARAGKEPRSQYQKSWLFNQTQWWEHKTHWLCCLIISNVSFWSGMGGLGSGWEGPAGGCHLLSGGSDPSVFVGSEFWSPELPWAVSGALGAGTSLERVMASSPALGARQPSGSCLPRVSVGFCGSWDGWISALLPQGSNNKWALLCFYTLCYLYYQFQ